MKNSVDLTDIQKAKFQDLNSQLKSEIGSLNYYVNKSVANLDVVCAMVKSVDDILKNMCDLLDSAGDTVENFNKRYENK